MTISSEQWATLESFRQGIEKEYTRSVVEKPERFQAYEDTLGVLKEAVDRYGIQRDDTIQVYSYMAGILSALSFVSQYCAVVCPDPHMMGHISEASIFMGYLIRELCFEIEAPYVGAVE